MIVYLNHGIYCNFANHFIIIKKEEIIFAYLTLEGNSMYFIFFYVFTLTAFFCKDTNANNSNIQDNKQQNSSQLRVVCTAALLNDKYDMRKKEYIKCMNTLAKFGIRNPYIIEAVKGHGPTFLDTLSTNVFYSKAHDFNVKDIRNKGVNEARTMLDGLNHFNFEPNDMILKLTGRYNLKSDKIIKLIQNNPDVDVFVKLIYKGTWPITGCFAMRNHLFKDLLENLDLKEMESKFIYIEAKVMDYINKMLKNKTGKVMFIDHLDLTANIVGGGHGHTYQF